MEVNIYDPDDETSDLRGFTIVEDLFRAFAVSF